MKDRLTNLISAGYSGIYLVTHEEQRAEAEILRAVHAVKPKDGGKFQLYSWTLGDGIYNMSTPGAVGGTEDPLSMLDALSTLPEKSVIMAKDLHLHLFGDPPDAIMIRKIKNALLLGKSSNRVLILCGCQLKLPLELEKWITVLEFKLPGEEELRVVLENLAEQAGDIDLNGNTQKILRAASGLTTTEAEDAFAYSRVKDKNILPETVAKIKADTVRKNGILEIIDTKTSLTDVGGLGGLKKWLMQRRLSFSDKAREYGLPIIKGILTVGPAGTGKSLSAKATASVLETPLLKLDAGRLFASHVGESEQNIRSAIHTAEAIAPCVLWIDEIEKGFSGSKSSGSTDGGTSARVFGTFLQWMQEKTTPVFVFATANDVSELPPEFLRKGRFDELFFIDLPTKIERVEIWKIHISKRGRKPKHFDLDALAELTAGFTGSEIEAIFNEALFAAFYEEAEPTVEHVMEAIKNTVPLSKTMGPKIEALRTWATGRTRPASEPEENITPKGRKLAA